MTAPGRPICRDLALLQLRSWKGISTRRHSAFTNTGLPRTKVAEKPKITLRRADYEEQRGRQCPQTPSTHNTNSRRTS